MGTTTFFLRRNNSARLLNDMTKKEREHFDKLSPYRDEPYYMGWDVPFELHNGNIYVLVFWKGRLMKLEKAPELLKKKYYSPFRGKEINEYEWTVLKKFILNTVKYLDKEFKKKTRRSRQKSGA